MIRIDKYIDIDRFLPLPENSDTFKYLEAVAGEFGSLMTEDKSERSAITGINQLMSCNPFGLAYNPIDDAADLEKWGTVGKNDIHMPRFGLYGANGVVFLNYRAFKEKNRFYGSKHKAVLPVSFLNSMIDDGSDREKFMHLDQESILAKALMDKETGTFMDHYHKTNVPEASQRCLVLNPPAGYENFPSYNIRNGEDKAMIKYMRLPDIRLKCMERAS